MYSSAIVFLLLTTPDLDDVHMGLTSGINHVTIPTPDLDRMARFYNEAFEAMTVFEAPASTNYPRMAIVELGEGRYVKLVEGTSGSPHAESRAERFGIAVASRQSLNALRVHMLAVGVDVDEIEQLPTQWVMWVRDPDGAALQVCAHR